jgi:hypothetical protein
MKSLRLTDDNTIRRVDRAGVIKNQLRRCGETEEFPETSITLNSYRTSVNPQWSQPRPFLRTHPKASLDDGLRCRHNDLFCGRHIRPPILDRRAIATRPLRFVRVELPAAAESFRVIARFGRSCALLFATGLSMSCFRLASPKFQSFWLLAALHLCGCGSGESIVTSEVKLTLTIDGKPAPGEMSVILAPMSKGAPVVIDIGADGTGTGKAVTGENLVYVVLKPGEAAAGPSGGHASVESKGIGLLFGSSDSPLRANVEASGPNEFTLEVGKAAAKAAAAAAGGHGGGHAGGHGS